MIVWIADTANEFVWQCCGESPPFCMIRDNAGHVYPHCIEDLHLLDESPYERVKPEGWTKP